MKIGFLRITAGLLAIFFVISVLVFVLLIHPNDRRIDFRAPDNKISINSGKKYRKKASLAQKNLELALGVSKEVLDRQKEIVSKNWKTTLSWNLGRFRYDFQAFVAVGKYPQFLDGREAVFIPPGVTLTMEARGLGEGIFEFGFMLGSSEGKLVVKDSEGAILGNFESTRVGFLESIKLGISPWIYPKNLRLNPKWHDIDLEIKKENRIMFECQDSDMGCFVSNLNFFQETSEPLRQSILILVDTMRHDAINSTVAPSIYDFMSRATFYEHAVAPGNMTSPSTNALLACTPPTYLGNWAFSYGVQDSQRADFEKRPNKSFPRMIQDIGIQTAMIGNISVVSEVIGVGQNHGFERQVSVEFDGYDTPLIAEEALKWIGQNRNRDFFLYIHFNAPHAPHRPPLRDIFKVWPGFRILKSYVQILDTLYSAEISYIDRYFQKIVDFLRELKLYDNLDMVVTSDHGDQMRPRNFSGNEWGPSFYGTYHDHGATLLDDEVRVPLIVKLKGQTGPEKIGHYVSTLQVGPTIFNQMTGEIAKNCYLPRLPTKEGDSSHRDHVLPIEGFRERAVIFNGQYKYIRAYEPTVKRVHPSEGYMAQRRPYYVKERLYDLINDPKEEDDVKTKSIQMLIDARRIYRDAFKIEVGYELVIDVKEASQIKIELPEFVRLKNLPSHFIQSGRTLLSQGRINGQRSFVLSDLNGKKPNVYIDEKPLKLLYMREKLPLEVDSTEELPYEDLGVEHLLPNNQYPIGYLRKIWDPNREERGIQVANPEFEAMLREWGYLNDN